MIHVHGVIVTVTTTQANHFNTIDNICIIMHACNKGAVPIYIWMYNTYLKFHTKFTLLQFNSLRWVSIIIARLFINLLVQTAATQDVL